MQINRLWTAAAIVSMLAFAGIASAVDITLSNPGFELAEDGAYSGVGEEPLTWDPNGSMADHAGFGPGNGANPAVLQDHFAYYTPSTEHVLQATGHTIDANNIYTFKGWALGGGNGTGTVGFVLGYVVPGSDTSDCLQSGEFEIFATQAYSTTGAWTEYAGVTAAPTAPAVGKELVVGFGPNLLNDPDDIWFDAASASYTVIPEPASLALLSLGGLALLRRRIA